MAVTTAPAGAAAKSDVVGHLYVNDNTAGANTVAGFDRHADGYVDAAARLPVLGRRRRTGKRNRLAGRPCRLQPDGRYLLAVDAGSNQISVLRLEPDGRLTAAGGSARSAPAARSPSASPSHDDLVYVANAGDGGSNYTGFTINAGGHLSPLADSTFRCPTAHAPGDVLFNGNGTRLAGTRVGTSLIDSFTVGS